MLTVLLADPFASTQQFVAAVRRLDPDLDIRLWGEGADPHADIIVAWELPPDYPRVPEATRAIFCFGAGIDQLVRDDRVAASIPIIRLLDEGQADHMADYVLAAAFAHLVGLPRHRLAQDAGQWSVSTAPRRHARAMTVTVLGTGFIGSRIVAKLVGAGFLMRCWSRQLRDLPEARCFAGWPQIGAATQEADMLINVLALTPDTVQVIDAPLLTLLAPGAAFVNIGRGGHVVEPALKAALDEGRLDHAWLDAFEQEPPPQASWLWSHPRVSVTPHIAGPPDPEGAAKSLIEATRAMMARKPVPGLIRGELPLGAFDAFRSG